jgi:hypothetical protein
MPNRRNGDRIPGRPIGPWTLSRNWACTECDSMVPHVHEYGDLGSRYYEDHSYDRGEEDAEA